MRKGLDNLLSDPRFRRRLLKWVQERWTFEKIEPMSTDEIFARLSRFGVAITPEEFRQGAQGHDSAESLADEWYEQYPLQFEGRYDEDFVWMAALVLWKRLVPDRIAFEQINDSMQEGYKLLEKRRIAEACDVWWQVWEWLKDKVTPQRSTVAALDEAFRGMQSVFNWCQGFQIELGNAGRSDPHYFRLLVRYCRQFLETFPHEELLRGNFLRAEGEALWDLGEVEAAEAKFKALIDRNPDWAWGYVAWSDKYWLLRDSRKDYDKAEAILREALARPNLEDREVILDRLDSLGEERARPGASKRRETRRWRRKR